MIIKLILFLLALCVLGMPAFSKERPPNVIFVLADDLGWAELACYGNSFNETPHLDKLAAGGTVFDRAYAQQAVRSEAPASKRAALLSHHPPKRKQHMS